MIEVTSGLIGLITGIAALASILIFIYNRGRQEGVHRGLRAGGLGEHHPLRHR